ncbi:MAG: Gfo/Idh/MocA family protein [Planctomycetaceae bacterium]
MIAPPAHLAPLPRDPSPGIGCVGAGFIMADCHLVAYAAAGFRPVAITAPRPQAAAAVAARHGIGRVWPDWRRLAADPGVEVVDIAVPPDVQPGIIDGVCAMVDRGESRVRGILAQKPLACDHPGAVRLVRRCREAGVRLVVNQNMRYDHAVRACGDLLARGILGEPVLATIDMRAIPHWMPWQERQGWVTLRIMSIHHFDTFRGWFGTPRRVFTSVRTDPRTLERFRHDDGICLSILEYDSGLRCSTLEDVWAGPAREGAEADCFVRFRVEGTRGLALGEVGWPKYPARTPSTLDWTTVHAVDGAAGWQRPRWEEAWFPDAFVGPMAELLRDLEGSAPAVATGEDNLETMALVDAAYLSAREHRAVEIQEIVEASGTG